MKLLVPIKDLDVMVYGVRLTIDESVMDATSGIDAVELIGISRDSSPTGDTTPEAVEPAAASIFESFAARSAEISGIPAAKKAPVGGYYFRVFTEEMDNTFINTSVADRSTDDEIIIDLTSGDGQYTLTLFMTPDFSSGFVVMQPYNESAAIKAPSALIESGGARYPVEYGSYEIEDAGDGLLSGNFIMAMQSESNPDMYLSIEGAFNRIPVESVD